MFSANSTKPCGHVALARRHRDPADEGGDQPVAEGDFGEAEGEEGEADRVDPLVARGQAAAGQAVVQAPAEHAEADADQRRRPPPRRPASPLRCRRRRPGVARTRKKRTKGSARPSLRPDSRLSVWRTGARDQARGDDRRGDHRVGRREHRAEQERLGPAQVGEERLGGERQQRHRDRHRDHQRPRDRAPVAAQQLALDEHPVGEEGEDQGQLDQLDDRLVGRRRRRRRRPRRARSRARPRAPRRRAPSPCITPESAATTASSPPKSSTASPKPMSTGYSRPCQQAALDEQLGDLDGVGRGALAQVVGDDPEVERALVAGVAADAADEDVVVARGVDRHRVARRRRGRRRRSRPAPRRAARGPAPGESGSRVSTLTASEWPVTTGTRTQVALTRIVVVAEDLAGLVDQLALLVGVVVAVGEAARLGQGVEGDLVGVDAATGVLAVEHRPRLGRAARRSPPCRCRRPPGRWRPPGARCPASS